MSQQLNFSKQKISTSLRWVGLVLLLFLALVFIAGQVVGIQGLSQAMDRLSPFTILLLVLAAAANTLIRFCNWPYFCRIQGISIPTRRLLVYHLAGLALLPTPGKLGTGLRLWLMRRYHHIPYRRSAPILMLDLLTDFLALIILVAIVLPWLNNSGAGMRLGIGLLAVTLAGIVLVLYYPPFPRACIKLAYKASGFRAPRFFATLLRLIVSLRVLVGPKNLVRTVGNALIGWVITTLAFAFLLTDLGYGPHLLATWPLSTFAIGCGITLGALSMIPGGLGGTEAILMAILLANHVGLAEATIFTALQRICTLWLPVGVGLCVLPFALNLHGHATAPAPATAPKGPKASPRSTSSRSKRSPRSGRSG